MKFHFPAFKFGTIGLLLLGLGLLVALPVAAQDMSTTVINVTLNEYHFIVEGQELDQPLQLESGTEYQIHFTNEGTLTHEVLIGSGPIDIGNEIHHDFEEALLGDVEVSVTGQMNDEEFVIGVAGLNEFELDPGQALDITFTLPDSKIGTWEIGCFVSVNLDAPADNPGVGHYDLGMHLPVEVVAASM